MFLPRQIEFNQELDLNVSVSALLMTFSVDYFAPQEAGPFWRRLMFHKSITPLAFASAAAFMMSACSHQRVRTHSEMTPPQNLSQGPRPTQRTTHYTVLEFAVGDSSLGPQEKKKIKNLDKAVQRHGKPVREIRVLAWSDETETRNPQLASLRASAVKSLLAGEIKGPVVLYNMTERPEKFAELVHEKDPQHRITYENTESASFGRGPKSSLVGKKDSKAIVMVRYEQ